MHLIIEKLENGQVPIYNFGTSYYYTWSASVWNIRTCTEGRAVLSTDIDEPLANFVGNLTNRLDILKGETDLLGTLVLAVRGIYDWEGEAILLGSLSFFDGITHGESLEGRDATYLIEQVCLGLAGKEYDRSDPYVEGYFTQRAIRLRDIEAKVKEAEEKALAILRSHLDEGQLAEFDAERQFHVLGRDGFEYLIDFKLYHNVARIEGGRKTVEYCLVTEEMVPVADQVLTQKLLLEANPALFHEKANSWVKLLTEPTSRDS